MMSDDPIITGAIIGGTLSAAGGIAATELSKQSIDEPDLPSDADANRKAALESRGRQESMTRFLNRSRSLGPIQLRAPSLRI